MTEMSKVEIHFHGGSTVIAAVTADDIANENDRLDELKELHQIPAGVEPVEDVFELVESAITCPPRPHWAWIGDAFVFTQAVCGFGLIDEEVL